MTIARRLCYGIGVVWCAVGGSLAAQTPTMPSTLRYGSGYVDVPASSVLGHMTVTGTLSGFWAGLDRRVLVGPDGSETGFGVGRDGVLLDGSIAIGVWDRVETGVSLQSFADGDDGGDVWGLFGRVQLWEPVDQGLGLAVGGRYVRGPTFADGLVRAPSRLGFADDRLLRTFDRFGVDSDVSLYAVGTAFVRGWDGGRLPTNDLSFTFGYGSGMFGAGGELDFYSGGHANGWFMGAGVHMTLSDRSLLTVMAEHNGFDVNVAAQADWDGFRAGVQYLALNHHEGPDGYASEYLKPKFGLTASVAICPYERMLRCRPTGMRRVEPDTVFIPPPPPDTVMVGRAEPEVVAVEGTSTICLSTGRNITVSFSESGDTLIGATRTPLAVLRPAVDFAGSYAGRAFWYQDGEPIAFEGGEFRQSDESFEADCSQLLRVGVFEGVPIFAVLSASRPLQVVFVPVRPGLWHRYVRAPG